MPTQGFEQVEDLLAIAEAPEYRSESTQIQSIGTDSDQMAGDPLQLTYQHTDVLRPPRRLDTHQLLNRAGKAAFVQHRAEVIGVVYIAGTCHVRAIFKDFLHAPMEVADYRCA